MAKLNISLCDEYAAMLSKLEGISDSIAKRAIYQGAAVAADAIKQSLENTVSDEATGDLVNSLGISHMDKDENGNWNVKIGFNGYDRKGVPNVLKARVLESGTSTRKKHPFVRPAMNKAKKNIESAMKKVIEEGFGKSIEN